MKAAQTSPEEQADSEGLEPNIGGVESAEGAIGLSGLFQPVTKVSTPFNPLLEGPYYPSVYPTEHDIDLVFVNGSEMPAKGEVAHLMGRVVTRDEKPVRNAIVKIWQADALGSFINEGGEGPRGRHVHFQGYGRCVTLDRRDITAFALLNRWLIHSMISSVRPIFTSL
ncbi:MAG: hypothetical protein AAF226_11635 [Verrucomicrobiota bacterium]